MYRFPPAIVLLIVLLLSVSLDAAQRNEKEKSDADPNRAPKIISIFPKNGATGVDASVPFVIVEFDMPMGEGFAFATRGDTGTPADPDNEKPFWSTNKKVCVKPVLLEPGKKYEHLINFPPFIGFRGENGVAADKLYYAFATGPAAVDKEKREKMKKEYAKRIELLGRPIVDDKGKPVDPKRAPKIVSVTPKNGDKNVDPKTAEIRITFDIPMDEGFSFATKGDTGTPADPDKATFWTEDRRTCVRPVKLEPGKKYEHLINFPPYIGFASVYGVPAPKLPYSFTTAE